MPIRRPMPWYGPDTHRHRTASVYPPCTPVLRFGRFWRLRRNAESITYVLSTRRRGSTPTPGTPSCLPVDGLVGLPRPQSRTGDKRLALRHHTSSGTASAEKSSAARSNRGRFASRDAIQSDPALRLNEAGTCIHRMQRISSISTTHFSTRTSFFTSMCELHSFALGSTRQIGSRVIPLYGRRAILSRSTLRKFLAALEGSHGWRR